MLKETKSIYTFEFPHFVINGQLLGNKVRIIVTQLLLQLLSDYWWSRCINANVTEFKISMAYYWPYHIIYECSPVLFFCFFSKVSLSESYDFINSIQSFASEPLTFFHNLRIYIVLAIFKNLKKFLSFIFFVRKKARQF